jgi:hypothetical protein
MLIKLKTLDTLCKIELVQVIEGHEVAIAPENVHLVLEDCQTLSVASARLLSNNEAVGLVVDDLLPELVACGILVSNCFQCLEHRLSRGGQFSLLFWLPLMFILSKLL